MVETRQNAILKELSELHHVCVQKTIKNSFSSRKSKYYDDIDDIDSYDYNDYHYDRRYRNIDMNSNDTVVRWRKAFSQFEIFQSKHPLIQMKIIHLMETSHGCPDESQLILQKHLDLAVKYTKEEYDIDEARCEITRLCDKFKMKPSQFRQMIHNANFTKHFGDLIGNLEIAPFNFCNMKQQFISFIKAENIYEQIMKEDNVTICKVNKLHINAWLSHYFKKIHKSFYVSLDKIQNKYISHFKKYVPNPDVEMLMSMLKTIMFDNKSMPMTREQYRTRRDRTFLYQTVSDFVELEEKTTQLTYKIALYSYSQNQNTIDSLIGKFESENIGIVLNENQKKAVHIGINNAISYVCGYPGTGKTTIADCIAYVSTQLNLVNKDDIYCIAYTGKASCNLATKAKNYNRGNCQTLHKFLYKCVPKFGDEEKRRMLIIDESSMIDMEFWGKLLMIIRRYKIKSIWLGDPDQCLPIGVGEPFRESVNNERLQSNVTRLTDVNRCNGQLTNVIKKMANKEIIDRSDLYGNVEFVETNDFSIANVHKLLQQFEYDPNNTSIIIPQHELTKVTTFNKSQNARLAVEPFSKLAINSSISMRYNPMGSKITNENRIYDFKTGDKVLRIQNEDEYANGMEGEITDYDRLNRKVTISYNMKVPAEIIDENELHELFEPAYACTTHKLQGSEKDKIIVFIHPQHSIWNMAGAFNILYTSISRAKEKLYIVGCYDTFIEAQYNISATKTLFMKDFDFEYDSD